MEPTRLLLASLFDPPVGSGPLARADVVRVTTSRGAAATAALLLGWLCDRLGWRSAESLRQGDGSCRVPRDGGAVLLELRTTGTTDPKAPITAIEIEGEGGAFSLRRTEAECVLARGAGFAERVVASPEHGDAELLVAGLGSRGRDRHLALALSRAAELFA